MKNEMPMPINPEENKEEAKASSPSIAPENSVKPGFPKEGVVCVVVGERGSRGGFYQNRRLSVGEKFNCMAKEHFGKWMKCVDPKWEKVRVEFLTEKGKIAIEEASLRDEIAKLKAENEALKAKR